MKRYPTPEPAILPFRTLDAACRDQNALARRWRAVVARYAVRSATHDQAVELARRAEPTLYALWFDLVWRKVRRATWKARRLNGIWPAEQASPAATNMSQTGEHDA